MKNRIFQAYKQAPWRIRTQWIGLFLLGFVLIATITGFYLSISGQAAESGREIQNIEQRINNLENEISQLTADLATAKSINRMKERSKELGLTLLNPHEAIFLEMPGYNPQAKLSLAPPKVNIIVESPLLLNTYRMSLWEWMKTNIWSISLSPREEVAP